jgi:hypothetical protein
MCGDDGMPVVCCQWRRRVQRQEQALQRWIHADDDVRSRAAAIADCTGTGTVATGDAASTGSDAASADTCASDACASDACAADACAANACAADACACFDRLRGRNDARRLRGHVVWECHTDQVLLVESSHWKVRPRLRYVLQSGKSRSYAQENSV